MKAVIFDMDGTLLDTFGDIMTAMNRFLASKGFPLLSRERMLQVIGHSSQDFIRDALPPSERKGDVSAYLDEYRAFYAALETSSTVLFDGMAEVLDQLTERGIRLAVLSNKSENLVIEAAALLKNWNFEIVWGDLDSRPYRPKPDPTMTQAILDHFGIDKSECVFVGDGDADIKTAVNIGMRSIAVLWGARNRSELASVGATEFAETPQQLAHLLGLK